MPTDAKVINIYKQRNIDHVYIGRPGKGVKGPWGNPVAEGKKCPQCGSIHKAGGDTLPCYKRILWHKIKYEPGFKEDLLALRGKNLGCFCAPNPCHGDVMLAAIEYLWQQQELSQTLSDIAAAMLESIPK